MFMLTGFVTSPRTYTFLELNLTTAKSNWGSLKKLESF